MTLSSTDKKEVRKFGAIAFPFFGLLCSVAIWRHKIILSCFFGTLSLFGLGFLTLPGPLKPLFERWLKVTHFIGTTITITMLALAYYIVITPAGKLKKIFGGAPIKLKPDKNISSYWVSRSEPAQPKERFTKLY